MIYKFSIVTYLNPVLAKKVRKLQKNLFKVTDSEAAIKLWKPHFTIGSGVKVSEKELKALYMDIKATLSYFKPFKVNINNCGSMDDWTGGDLPGHTPYVIYLRVILNKKLSRLARIIKEKVTDKRKIWYGQPWPFKPHVALANKDLSKKGFIKGKEISKHEKFSGKDIIDHLSLAIEDKNGKWIEYKKYKFIKKYLNRILN